MKNKKGIVRFIAMTAITLIVVTMLAMLVGCAPSEQEFNETQSVTRDVTYATIITPDGERIEGTVTGVPYYYTNGTVKLTVDGIEYRTHISNVLLITK